MYLLSSRIAAILLAAILALSAAACRTEEPQQVGTAPGEAYTTGEPQQEDGSGRFYMGREIATITGHDSAEWLERPSREQTELPSRVLHGLALRPEEVVADIGAGTGYFSLRIAEKVPEGRVYAVDVQSEMLELLEQRIGEQGIENVVPVLGTPTRPNLPPSSIDVALMVDAYHEFSHPREMMEEIVESLKPGGRVVVVEYRAEDPTIPVKPVHRMSEEQVRREMETVGLTWVESKEILPQQHFIVLEKPSR